MPRIGPRLHGSRTRRVKQWLVQDPVSQIGTTVEYKKSEGGLSMSDVRCANTSHVERKLKKLSSCSASS